MFWLVARWAVHRFISYPCWHYITRSIRSWDLCSLEAIYSQCMESIATLELYTDKKIKGDK